MRYCLFYVAKTDEIKQGAIISMYWMMKMQLEPKKVAKPGDVPVTTPKLQNITNRERPSQVSTFNLEVRQLPQAKPKPSPDHVFIQIPENYTGEEEPSPL